MAFKYGKDSSLTGADALVRGIGLFSLGLGVAELIAPGKIAKTFGLEGKEGLLRAFGAREIASGIGTLSADPQPALWSRVGGDVLDMATLAFGARSDRQDAKRNALIGIGAVAGIAALDAFAATLMSKRGGERPPPADYSDRSGLPKGIEASRGYYRQKKERGPAVAHHDARDDRHSGGGGKSGSGTAPDRMETDAAQSPVSTG
ncbi:hypothetical protein [Sphingomonas sp.]|jgi:hypothetical protein|uniref:hypothetical protein n=1 Tax=Sphingomonas sp. TaxID=28214 RepID=UPI002DF5F62E|nr:hypothetical protein [Sphingomonas sp.]